MENVVELLKSLKTMLREDFVKEGYGTVEEWQRIQDAPSGRIVIRIIEGGNEYLKIGDSKSGITPYLCLGMPVLIEFPNGYYKSTEVKSIDWEHGTFTTLCSTYSFHFCNN